MLLSANVWLKDDERAQEHGGQIVGISWPDLEQPSGMSLLGKEARGQGCGVVCTWSVCYLSIVCSLWQRRDEADS